MRSATITRTTSETAIKLTLGLDGAGSADIKTGFPFADHMLTLMAFWARFDLALACDGDLEIDAHHSLEDVGLALGDALRQALGDKAGISRVGFATVPMDEARAEAAVDLSGRPYLVFDDALLPAAIAGEEKDLWREFLKSFAFNGRFNCHVRLLYGTNGHHLLESAFKGLGLALGQAAAVTRSGVTSTKGMLA